MFRYRNVSLLLLLTMTLSLLVACGDKKETTKTPTEITPADIQLYLGAPQIEYAGIYAAISQGYFEDEKLNVDLKFAISAEESGGGITSFDAVGTGGMVFADGTAEGLLQMRQKGHDFVCLLTLYQRDSRSIVSTPDKGITTPQDLVGKRLLLVPGTESITTVFLTTLGINPDDVTLVGAEGQGVDWLVTQILTGAVDAMVFSIEGAAQMEAAGLGSSRIAFYDYGVQSYANVIFTSGQLVQENPEVVQRFVNAVLRGLQYVVERPAEVAAWFVEHYGEELHPLQVDVQDEAVLAIIPLIQTATSKPGMMSAETWDYLDTNMVALGLLDASVNVEEMYTMQFLDAYYQK